MINISLQLPVVMDFFFLEDTTKHGKYIDLSYRTGRLLLKLKPISLYEGEKIESE